MPSRHQCGARPANNECLICDCSPGEDACLLSLATVWGARAGCAGPPRVALDGGNYSAMDRVPHKLRVGGDAQLLHDPGLVKPDGSVGNFKDVSNLLKRATFCEHLQNFTLPVGELFSAIQRVGVPDKVLFHGAADLRSHIRDSPYYVVDCLQQLGWL